MTPEQKARIEKEAGIAWEKYCEGLPDKDTPNPYAFAAGYKINATELSAARQLISGLKKQLENLNLDNEKLKKENDDLYDALLTLLDEHESLCREIKAQIQQQRKGK